jgi:fermentation-respiration switch protein FrsA (DUF1100 family)
LIGLGVLVLAIVSVLALLWLVQRQLIYLPTQEVPAPPRGVERVTFRTEDGLTLAAWLMQSRAGTERGTVLVFNGNAGNRAQRVPLGLALANEGFSVLLTDYRGYGANPGSPSEEGLAMDARAALEYLRSERGVAWNRLAFFGESLGAGVAVGLAEEMPPAALVLRSPFASLADIASVHYAWVPASLLLRDRYANAERVAAIDVPVMVIAGSDDRIVPIEQSSEVFEAANAPKRMLVIEGARHNDLELLSGAKMVEGMTEFLDEALSR